MPRPKTIQIEKDGVTGQCTRESLKVWERNGWTVVDDGTSEPAAVESVDESQMDEPFIYTTKE